MEKEQSEEITRLIDLLKKHDSIRMKYSKQYPVVSKFAKDFLFYEKAPKPLQDVEIEIRQEVKAILASDSCNCIEILKTLSKVDFEYRDRLINRFVPVLVKNIYIKDFEVKRSVLANIIYRFYKQLFDDDIGNKLRMSLLFELYNFIVPYHFEKDFTMFHMAVKTNHPVLITGESGTGKEMLARMIHDLSRGDKPFQAFNCSAIPIALFESELFGYKEGAFTGAKKSRDGILKIASDGSAFIDEIGDLELTAQVKILRVLQDKNVIPLGSGKAEAIQCRFIFATHQNLKALIKEGKFRSDLYHRINTVHLRLKPVTEAFQDYGRLLIYVVLDRIAVEDNLTIHRKPLTDKAMEKLASYHYPGNFRELFNILRRALFLADGETITDKDILFDDIDDERQSSNLPDINSMTLKEVELYAEKQKAEAVRIAETQKNELLKAKVQEMLERNNGLLQKCAIEAGLVQEGDPESKKKNAGDRFKKKYCLPYDLDFRDYR